jgi:hypothetical protein
MEAGDPHQKLRAQIKTCETKDGQSYLMRTPEHTQKAIKSAPTELQQNRNPKHVQIKKRRRYNKQNKESFVLNLEVHKKPQ